jgi:hypothetical protein
MKTVRGSVLALFLSCVMGALGCGVGEATGPGDDSSDDSDDGAEPDAGESTEGGADAAPGGGDETALCATEYTVLGGVDHDEEPQGTCDGSGRWEVSYATPVADSDSVACDDAPAAGTFTFTVTRNGDAYSAVDDDNGARTWTVQIRDKSGACSATFTHDAGGGAAWALIPAEEGPGGPLDGVARFERSAP